MTPSRFAAMVVWAQFVKQVASGTHWAIPNHFKILLRAVPEEPQATV